MHTFSGHIQSEGGVCCMHYPKSNVSLHLLLGIMLRQRTAYGKLAGDDRIVSFQLKQIREFDLDGNLLKENRDDQGSCDACENVDDPILDVE
jgi:hypothetical protein